MKQLGIVLFLIFGVSIAAGCASTNGSAQDPASKVSVLQLNTRTLLVEADATVFRLRRRGLISMAATGGASDQEKAAIEQGGFLASQAAFGEAELTNEDAAKLASKGNDLRKLLLFRAAEETLSRGYQSFRIVVTRDNSTPYTVERNGAGYATTNGYVGPNGSVTATTEASYTPASSRTYSVPTMSIEIQMLTGAESSRSEGTFDARLLAQQAPSRL